MNFKATLFLCRDNRDFDSDEPYHFVPETQPWFPNLEAPPPVRPRNCRAHYKLDSKCPVVIYV